MYRCGDYKWQTKNVLIEWKKPLAKDIDIFANSSLPLYVSIFRMDCGDTANWKEKHFFLVLKNMLNQIEVKYYKSYEQENT